MTKKKDSPPPSLLDPEARGGDIAEGGISFQTGVILTYLPGWLAREGFTMLLREGLGDAEARFFVPGFGFRKEFIEVKDHPVGPAEFWKEIDRFRQMDAVMDSEFQWFRLATTGLSEKLQPLVNGLRRIREPYDFYDTETSILESSHQDYERRVIELGHSREEANFLYRKVLIQDDLSLLKNHAKAIFKQAIQDDFSEFEDLSYRFLDAIYTGVGVFMESRRNKPIYRNELESRIMSYIPTSFKITARSIHMYTGNGQPVAKKDENAIQFKWPKFFSDSAGDYPSPAVWNSELLGQLHATRDWIVTHRSNRRLRISGDRRLSANLALGWVFSAVAGFTIEMMYRDEIWASDAHPQSDTPPYKINVSGVTPGKKGQRLVVVLGILRDIAPNVNYALPVYGLEQMPILYLTGSAALESPAQVNLAVRQIKAHLANALAETSAKQIDLFIVGPAHLALFLGHRLNGLAPIQCYNWTDAGLYAPTCLLD